MWQLVQWGTVFAVLLMAHGALAADQNHFASIYLDGKKIGQVQYTVRTNDQGVVERSLRREARCLSLAFKFITLLRICTRFGKVANCKACRETLMITVQSTSRHSREIPLNTTAYSMTRL